MDSRSPNPPPAPATGIGRSKLIAVVIVIVVIIAGVITAYELTRGSSNSSKTTITVWGSGTPGGEEQSFNQSLAAFELAYPNVTVKDSPAIGVGATTFISAAHAGSAPDVFRDTSDSAGASFVAGAVMDLTPYLNQSLINSYTSGTISDWTYNGSIYGIPQNTNGIGLYYNQSMVPNPPKNVYQMLQDAQNVTGGGKYGLAYDLGKDNGYRFAAWLPAFGGEIFNSSYYPELNSSPDIAAMSFVWNWTVRYNVDPAGITASDEQNLFETGKSAFMLDGPWAQYTYEQALGKNLNVTAIPFDNATGKWPAPIWGSTGYVITTHQASGITQSQLWASLKFIEFMTNNASQVNMFKLSGDFPALKEAGSYIVNHTFNDSLIGGWLEQEQHTQIQPNFPQMSYYWPNFLIGATDLEQNTSKVTVTSVMNEIEAGIISDLQTNGLPYVSFVAAQTLVQAASSAGTFSPAHIIAAPTIRYT